MPIYEYQCEQCGHRFEVIQKFSDAPREKCPKCEGTLRKLPPAPAFQFKGTGWYITDYARKDSAAAAKSDGAKSDTKDGGGASESTADNKTDKKTESKTDKTTDKTTDKKAATKSDPS